jgi:hypothetical protein
MVFVEQNQKIDNMEIGHPVIGEWGCWGLLKTVERSIMTFPDAHILLYLIIYIIKVY